MTIWILIVSFFLILIVIALINYKINKEFKVEISWLALSMVPIILLLTTQQLSEFSGSGLAIKLKEVSASEVSLQVDGDAIQPEHLSRDEKGGIGKIEQFKRNRVAAVALVVGKQNYYNNRAIVLYLRELLPMSFFRYVQFEDIEGRFRGVIDGSRLFGQLQDGLDLVRLIESNDVSAINGISAISIASGSSKQESLQLMDRHGLAELPVVDDFGKFVGIVDRNRITSSIVAQLVSSSDNAN